MSLDDAREAYVEALAAHDADLCDSLVCPWCQGLDPDVQDFEDPDPEDFESEDDDD